MPTSIHTGSDTDFSDMPSPDMIENWQNDQTKGPVVKETEAQPKEEAPKEAAPQPEPEKVQAEEKTQTEVKPETPIEGEKKKTKYQLAQEQTKQDEHKRNEAWKQIREAKAEVEKLRQEVQKAKEGLDKTPEEWLQLAQWFEDKGIYDQAELARQNANKVQQHLDKQNNFQKSQKEVEEQWHRAEADIAAQDPLFYQEGSYVRDGLEKIFSDPQQASLYMSHPLGIWAAYWNVQTQYAQKIIPPLVKYCQDLEAEVQKFRKSTEPLGSAPRGVSLEDGKKFTELNEKQMEAALAKQFDAMS